MLTGYAQREHDDCEVPKRCKPIEPANSVTMTRDAQPLLSLIGRGEASIIDVWLARVAQTPDSTFLKFSGRQWTYGEAWEEILRYSAGLTRLGLRPGERVASYLGNRAETLWTWFGTLAAGGIYCPLNRAHKGTILQEMNDRSRASIFITERSAATDMPAMPSSVRATMVDDELFFNVDAAIFEPARPDPYDDALVIYTSGTTGGSKPVRLSHQLFAHQAGRVVEAWGLTPEDVFHAWLPHFHIAGTLHQTMGTIVAGGTLLIQHNHPAFRPEKTLSVQRVAGRATLSCSFDRSNFRRLLA